MMIENDDSLSSLSFIGANSTSIPPLQQNSESSLPPPSPTQGKPKASALSLPAATELTSQEAPPSSPGPTVPPSSPVVSSAREFTRAPNHPPATAVRIAIDMRTRSSRLFFVLLHLVGVSTNVPIDRSPPHWPRGSSGIYSTSSFFAFVRQHRPPWLTWSVGIVGVQPTAILLERLDLQSSRRGVQGIVERVERVWGWDSEEFLSDPYWFQDDVDGQCLDPGGGFSECGDATLWRLRRKPLTKKQLREKRYKTRHRKRPQDKRENWDSQPNQRPPQQQREQIYPGSSISSVCVWPFLCEQVTPVLQPTETDHDEIYGFEYEESEWKEGFALQLMDVDVIINLNKRLTRRHHKSRLFWISNKQDEDVLDPHSECLISSPSESVDGRSTLHVGPCSSEAAWVWHVNREGTLIRGSTKAEKRRWKRRWRLSPRRASVATTAGTDSASSGQLNSLPWAEFGCVYRANSTLAMLLSCDAKQHNKAEDTLMVKFSLVRYPTASSRSPPPRQTMGNNDVLSWEPWSAFEGPSASSLEDDSQAPVYNVQDNYASANIPVQHFLASRTSSQNHASTGVRHRHKVDLKSTASMLHTSLEQVGKTKKDAATTSASHIRDAPVAMNGVAFHNQLMNKAAGGENSDRPSMDPSHMKLRLKTKIKDGKNACAQGQTPIHDDPFGTRGSDHCGHLDSTTYRSRKIPVHPYIQSSKDFIWVDPLTSLEYPTDLCSYLGHTKQEAGRHTLMGVGQYFRTAFNIKVYGAALYVAKRDVLADPKFGEYATLSSKDLQRRGDFYEHLMNMPSPGEDPSHSVGGFFDRTLFIKTNMQLSTDAMRKSLEADWSLLTEEMKSLIISTSFKPRIADETMLRRIQSKENSSNCSCGQSAPPQFDADPSCCARGTELVFTWRKNSVFEIRLDGRIMDIFPRPDIAKGIFSEYLNENPISLDAKAHFADGFPFLLAPLAQVKGMSSAVPSQTHESIKKLNSPSTHNPMHRLMDVAMQSMGAMNSQAHSLSKWMHGSAADMSFSALGSAMSFARGLSEELDRQRMELLEGAAALQREGMERLSSLIKVSIEEDRLALTFVNRGKPGLSPFSITSQIFKDDAGLKMSPRDFIPDEIGIKIEPNMNFTHRLFFTTVHVYLLLLFVVSLQGSHCSRLVVKRRILETGSFVELQSYSDFATMNKLHRRPE